MSKSSRLTAFEILHRISTDGSYSNIALDSALTDIEGDKAFVSALVYGVCERQLTLDYFINKYADKKPKAKVMTVLRLGAYQLLYMDKVPSSAAINESVRLVKEIKQDYYSGLVNAVLRRIDADSEDISGNLSLYYSVPENLINMWIKQYGDETVRSFLPSVNGRPPVYAVPNSLYVDASELEYELMDEGVECETEGELVKINSGVDIKKLRAYKNGLFHIEDKSSYECACALSAESGEVVLDICSAPGGKSFTIAEKMGNKGFLYAFDLYENRLELVKNGAKRLGLDIVETSVNDASVYNDNMPVADRILCDVPCSGFGIIRRKPEIRYKELDSVKGLPSLQLDILNNSVKYLKSGGTIIYSTCTLNKKENEFVIDSFLKEDNNFTLCEMKTVFPDIHGGDGFFYAKLIKNEK